MNPATGYDPNLEKAKQESRNKLKSFIARYFSRKQRKNTNAICLPSVGFHDYHEVFYPLGFAKENIVGLEKNPEIYKQMEKINPGIKIYNMSDMEYLRETKDRFGVISLDYTGQFSVGFLSDANENIFERGTLESLGILHTNFYGSRDKRKEADYSVTEDATKISKYVAHKYDILTNAEGQKIKHSFDEHVEKFGTDGGLERMRNMIPSQIASIAVSISNDGMRMPDLIQKTDGGKYSLRPDLIDEPETIKFFKELMGIGVPGPILAFILLSEGRHKSYFLQDCKSYRYVGSKGSPMLTDFFSFRKYEDELDLTKYKVEPFKECHIDEPHTKIKFAGPGKCNHFCRYTSVSVGGLDASAEDSLNHPLIKSAVSYMNRLGIACISTYSKIPDNREELGYTSSFFKAKHETQVKKPAKKVDFSYPKEIVYEMIESGISDSEIMERTGIERKSLSACKAWVTMRKHGK